MEKLLILGGSHRDIPLIKAAQELNLHVITVGNGKHYLGHRYANESFEINFNDLDEVSRLIRKLQIDHLCPGCGEQALIATIVLSKRHRIGFFDSIENTLLLHDKFRFKEFCLKNKISVPGGCQITKTHKISLEGLRFPIIVKPVNLSGGNGVFVVHDEVGLRSAVASAQEVSKRETVLLEEFIEGDLIAYSTFIKNKEVAMGFSARDTTYLNKYLITTSYPQPIPEAVLEKLNADIRILCQTLNLCDGPFHFQVIVRDRVPYIIDITRRIPGDLFPYLIEFSTGVQYCKNVVRAAIGFSVDGEDFKVKKSEHIIRHCIMPDFAGTFKEMQISPDVRAKIFHELYLVPKGDEIKDPLRYQIGISFLRCSDENEMLDVAAKINALIHPVIERRNNHGR